jgi:hypothetical protein
MSDKVILVTDAAGRTVPTWGVESIDENGGGPGVRLHKRHQKER